MIHTSTSSFEKASQRLQQKQEWAKTGMTISLALTAVSGFMRGRQARTVHVWSGLALIGFSVWHHRLYRPDMLERELQAVSRREKSSS